MALFSTTFLNFASFAPSAENSIALYVKVLISTHECNPLSDIFSILITLETSLCIVKWIRNLSEHVERSF